MTSYMIPGLLGLMTGLLLRWAGLNRRDGLRFALGLRRSLTLRTSLMALGWGILLTALLMWLAVIDVDTVIVLPLSLGTLLGGLLLGIIEILSKAYISTQLSDVIVFGVLIVILLVKPAGLLGKKINEKV